MQEHKIKHTVFKVEKISMKKCEANGHNVSIHWNSIEKDWKTCMFV